MERALFSAEESQLSKRQMCSQLIHGGLREELLRVAYSSVGRLNWEIKTSRRAAHHNIRDKKPATLNQDNWKLCMSWINIIIIIIIVVVIIIIIINV